MFNITHYRQANASEINEKMLYSFFRKGGGDQGLRVSQRGNEESKNIKSGRNSTKGRGNSVAGTTRKLSKIM